MGMVRCPACAGSGRTEGKRCDACRGNGLVLAEDTPAVDPEALRSILEAVKVIPLRPGDVILAKVPSPIADSTADRIRQGLADVFVGHRIVVLSGGVDIEVVRREEIED